MSPHLASATIGCSISLDRILQDYAQIEGSLIVEGEGGTLVPLNSDALIVDMIQAINLPTIVVASTKLGGINHRLLTLEALRHRKIQVEGVITTGKVNSDFEKSIAHYGKVRIIGHVPHSSSFSRDWFAEACSSLKFPSLS